MKSEDPGFFIVNSTAFSDHLGLHWPSRGFGDIGGRCDFVAMFRSRLLIQSFHKLAVQQTISGADDDDRSAIND